MSDCSDARAKGTALILERAQRQLQTFFDELKNGTQNYRTVASLSGQIAQEYRGRCVLELLQNAHDALAHAESADPRRISFVLKTSPDPVLLVGNSGRPFLVEDLEAICQLGLSPKDPNESVGNKGLGFRSVLEVCTCPEIWSTADVETNTSFVFRFDPAAADRIAAAAHELNERGLGTRSPFDHNSALLDWSDQQLDQYQKRLVANGFNAADEAKTFLSPYLFPLPVEDVRPDVEQLLGARHVTVIRLQLDGGRTGSSAEAVASLTDQLDGLSARSTVFLQHLSTLSIEVDGQRRELERHVESQPDLARGERTREQKLIVRSSGPGPVGNCVHQFHVWTRDLGGDEDPVQAQRIREVVDHLPNRWPEVRRLSVGIAVGDAPSADDGVFVIFLPTETSTGTGAHINAPFYGSLDRRQINFDDPYNELLLEAVLDLSLDITKGLVSGQPEAWCARAVIDILASIATVGGKTWRLMDRLNDRAAECGFALADLPLVLCDGAWTLPGAARVMPAVPEDCPIEATQWRVNAAFDVLSSALDGRRNGVQQLLSKLDASERPTAPEWRSTIENIAARVHARDIDVTWDDFLKSVVAVLPGNLLSTPTDASADPLAAGRFLPTQDGRLLRATDTAKLFFQPARGGDDAAELVEDVPRALERRVAFLHPDVRTQEGPQGRNTSVQKFLDARFARSFRREDLIRDVVLTAVPQLPASHGSADGDSCAALLSWTLKLLEKEESDSLLPLLKRLPVACHGGWFAMRDAAFGPGWDGHLGDQLWILAAELGGDREARIRRTALLPPDDDRWGVEVDQKARLFARVGVVDGLRLVPSLDVRFQMRGYGWHDLPAQPPGDVPQAAWDDWRDTVRTEVKPYYEGTFDYSLSGIKLLPEIHSLNALSRPARKALSQLIVASLKQWPADWKRARISKLDGQSWSRNVTSPLMYWLATFPWLDDRAPLERPVSDRWLVPESLLLGQRDRFAHLHPLSIELAHRLHAEPDLRMELSELGLNLYPVEDELIGPQLLDALASGWMAKKVPPQRLDIFLGQVRDAWRHLDPEMGLPNTFLVTTGRRRFSARGADDLADVYLPDDRNRTRSLVEHGKPILEMNANDAARLAERLQVVTGIRRASALTERVVVDGEPWQGAAGEAQLLSETRFAWWPVALLAVAAHGGDRPTGAATQKWRDARDAMRGARVVECESVAVQLVDGEIVVAASEPDAKWLVGNVLAVRRGTGLSYGSLAPAAQAILERQDLLKDLRLVLGSLAGQEEPTPEQIEAALERAEIDAQAVADIRHQWASTTSLLVDRIRPVLTVLHIPGDGLEAAATTLEGLTDWLSGTQLKWPVEDLLSAARRSHDDRAMGEAAWHALGEDAQLPAWNRALTELGERYVPVANRGADEQVAAHLDAATPLLRALARHVALAENDPSLFQAVEAVTQSFELPSEWMTRWWEVPFAAVVDALRDGYAAIPIAARHLEMLTEAKTIGDLRSAFEERRIATEPSPYETASLNRNELRSVLARLNDLQRAWRALHESASIPSGAPEPPAEVDRTAYLRQWSASELIGMALSIIDDSEFAAACQGCATLDEIGDRLRIDPAAVDARRQERLRRDREAERQRRTFAVAGASFEVGASSYSELFRRLSELAAPVGPAASEDAFTPLTDARSGGSGSGGGGTTGGNTSHRRPSSELRELVGVVGEMQAYRFLRAEFGGDTVTRDAWVSELRMRVLPLVQGEKDETSDGHGFDFKFRHGGKLWHVEVKATQGDDLQFELGLSEIETASRLARSRGKPWRILRVSNTLSDQPSFEWLPNPFEEGFRKHFRLRRGGMMVSYARR